MQCDTLYFIKVGWIYCIVLYSRILNVDGNISDHKATYATNIVYAVRCLKAYINSDRNICGFMVTNISINKEFENLKLYIISNQLL